MRSASASSSTSSCSASGVRRARVLTGLVLSILSVALPALVACGGAIDAPHGDGTESKASTPPAGSAAPAPPASSGVMPGVVGPNHTCEAPKCNVGDVTEAGIRFCPPGATCYQRSSCGTTVYCTSYSQCDVQPVCPPGYQLVASCLSSGTPDCVEQTSCGVTIECEASPDTDAGF